MKQEVCGTSCLGLIRKTRSLRLKIHHKGFKLRLTTNTAEGLSSTSAY